MEKRLCDKCKQHEATVYLNKVVDGYQSSVALCQNCVGNLSSPEDVVNLFEQYSSDFEANKKAVVPTMPQKEDVKCESCGTMASEFASTMFVGCPDCYEKFSDIISEVVMDTEEKSEEDEKPDNQEKSVEEKTAEDLKIELAQAIDGEDFEKAANLRDKIVELEKDNESKDVDKEDG